MVGGGEQEITAAQLDPRFALLGGDLAYANALPTCYRVWDKWFDMWEENMITRDVRTQHTRTHHTYTTRNTQHATRTHHTYTTRNTQHTHTHTHTHTNLLFV